VYLIGEKQQTNLPMKDTKFFDSIANNFTTSDILNSFLFNFLSNSKFTAIWSEPRSLVCRKAVVKFLILTKFLQFNSVHQVIHSSFKDLIPFGKDVFYTIKNSCKINWRKCLLDQAIECIEKVEIKPDAKQAHEVPCLVIDDSDLPKRGKFIEYIGRIFSHVTHKYHLGFKSLNLAYWTGKTLLHLDFSLHIESGKNGQQGLSKKQIKQRFTKQRPDGSMGHQRIMETTEKKTKILLKMLDRVISKGVKAPYILVDSWFFNQKLLAFAIAHQLHLISRPKFNNWRYTHNDKDYTIGMLVKKYRNHKSRKWSRKIGLHHLSIDAKFKGISVKIFLYKNKKRGSKWQAIITSHKGVSAIRAYQIYQNRWSIEVSYKELKQEFKYGKCQARDFDAHIADNTISLMAYNYLSTYKCVNQYQSIGALFMEIKETWVSPTVMQKYWITIVKVLNKVADLFNIQIEEIMEKLISHDNLLHIFNLDSLHLTAET